MTATASGMHSHQRMETAIVGLLEVAEEQAKAGSQLVWTGRVERAARSLERALRDHRESAEQQGGALEELLDEKPALAEAAAEQESEHLDLLQRVETLATACQRAIEFEDPNIELLRLDAQIAGLLARRHLVRETQLYYEAFFQEEGGEEG